LQHAGAISASKLGWAIVDREGDVVRAAGGVVLRRGPAGKLETVLVHRPAYDDWTLPKGKLLKGETEEDAAVREVEEETGLRCELGRELGTTAYRDAQGRQKTARYWEMTPIRGKLAPTNEVDDARWVGVENAADLLTYARDRELLAKLGAVE
jgi:8-oxo-dGTP diphosphatase